MQEMKSLDLIYKETKEQIERQFGTLIALDTKANIAAGLTGVITGIIAIQVKPSFTNWIWIIPMAVLLGSLFCSLGGLWIVGWRSDPAPSGMKFYLTEEESKSKRQFLENLIQSFEENRKRINKKV